MSKKLLAIGSETDGVSTNRFQIQSYNDIVLHTYTEYDYKAQKAKSVISDRK